MEGWKILKGPCPTVQGDGFYGVSIVRGVIDIRTSSIDRGSETSLTGPKTLVVVVAVVFVLHVVTERVTFVAAMIVETGSTICTMKTSTL